jgi:succinate dehydrogenase hydrophobic anchor subunit
MVIIEKSKEQKYSEYVLWAIMAVSAVVLVIFFAWGYDTPYEENPQFIAPLFSDGLIILQVALIILCAFLMVGGAINSLTIGGKKNQELTTIADKVSNPIAWGTCFVSLVIGVIYGITFKDEAMIINNQAWQNPTESIMADICIWSILILIAGTVVAGIYSMATRK